MQKLAIISTHPIQYNAPFFKLLTKRGQIKIKVFYTWSQSEVGLKFDPGFGKDIQWDLPLLEEYDYCFVNNVSTTPGSHHYKGIDNPTLVNEVQLWGANAILVYGWSFKSHFKAMRFFHGKIPVLFRGDSTLLDEKRGVKKFVRKYFLRYVYSHVNVAMYAGSANKLYFESNGLKEKQLFFMPHAVDNDRFKEDEFTRNKSLELRKQLKINDDALVFLFAGKLEPKKQPDFLAEIFLQLNNPNVFLIIAGTGILENNMKQKYDMNTNIKFVGFQNQLQMPILYSICNVFILPSKGPGETWGLSINEAMAAGKAIIASNACGAAYDLIENNSNGFVFDKNDNENLLSCMQYFINNNHAAKRMGEVSFNKIQAYNFESDCRAVENLLMLLENKNHN